MNEAKSTIVLVAPNLSTTMGGEAMKALSYYRELVAQGYDVVQVAHERCRSHVERDLPGADIHYAPDGVLQRNLHRLKAPATIVSALDVVGLTRLARRIARERDAAIVHITSPISPVQPHLPIPEAPVVIGPINGNIFYPPAFRTGEGQGAAVKRRAMPIVQRALGGVFRGKHRADAILVAGGARTRQALAQAGVAPSRLIDTLDSGVAPELLDYAPVDHSGRNPRFVFFGRLVEYKGCDLAIRALAAAEARDLTLDVIGTGAFEPQLRALAAELGVADRVHFLGWMQNGPALFDRLRGYRAFVYPSLAEANGIVLQEAMMLGLPIVALDWGGAAALMDHCSGVLIAPDSRDAVVAGIAAAIDRLADDPVYANGLGHEARATAEAEGYAWPALARAWVAIYDRVLAARGRPPLSHSAADHP